MSLEQIAERVVENDVLIVGGGIAGCCAAAKAAEHGLNVTLAEKAKTDRSGSAAGGIDHYMGAFPRGMTPQDWLDTLEKLGRSVLSQKLLYSDPNYVYRIYANGHWAIEELEKLGIPMKWDDDGLRSISFMMGGPFIRVRWQNVKPQLAVAVRKRGANVLERVMIIDLLTSNGDIVGATAINTRTSEFIVVKAKATVIATAACSRVYNPETPIPWKYKFNYHWCPSSVSGDGWAMAYRAGAELSSMEQAGRGYRMRDDKVLSWGNTGNEGLTAYRYTWDGELQARGRSQTSDQNELARQGRDDPMYFTLENLPEDYQKRIEVAFVDERMVSFKIAEDRGFNPKTHWYELMDNRPNQLHIPPGIWADGDFKASSKGLYAIGDCLAGGHGCSTCTTSGLLVGDSIHTFVNDAAEPVVDEAQVESQKQTALAPLEVKDGTEPMELEVAIRYICDRYVGVSKAEGRLREGLRRLRTLRREFLPRLMTKGNPHYLMRALEVRNLMDVAELHIQASLDRTETRGEHIRLDYPETNPAWDGMLAYQRLEDGKPVLEMRKQTELNMDLRATR